jgi:hypothetical protein
MKMVTINDDDIIENARQFWDLRRLKPNRPLRVDPNDIPPRPCATKRSSSRGQASTQERLSELDERNDNISTPMWLVDQMIDMLELKNDMSICDPCCGLDHRFGTRIRERFRKRNAKFDELDIRLGLDFFHFQPHRGYHRFIMNPPFSELGAFKFIQRALRYLDPGGRIIAVVPNYILDNADGRKDFWAKHLYKLAFIPKKTFIDDGCDVLHGSVIDIRPYGCESFLYLQPKTGQMNLFD